MPSSLLLRKTSLICLVAVFGFVARAEAGTCANFTAPVWRYTAPQESDVIFNGTIDPDGNLYWLEYQRRFETQQLVSASRDGSIRYRTDFYRSPENHLITRGTIWANGLVLTATEDNHIRAFDAESGSLVWDAVVTEGNYWGELTDTGTGVIVASFGYVGGTRISGIDLASGEELWAHTGETSVATASGDIFLAERDSNRQIFLTKTDSSGTDIWSELAYRSPVAVVGGETAMIDSFRIAVQKNWWEVPSPGHSNIVVGSDFGFLITLRPDYYQDHLLSFSASDGSVLGEQAITPGYPIYFNGTSLLANDHLLLVWQETEPCDGPCFCHPRSFRQARVSAWSKQAEELLRCDLPNLGETSIEAASLFHGTLVIGRRHYFTITCTTEIQPLIIEAYDVPGEELAEQGWVVPAGNPAQSRRPLQ